MGHVPASFNALPTGASFVKEGKLRALAITSGRRNVAVPDVPTMAEAGSPGQEVEIMIGMLAPAGTPPAIVDTLYREISRITALPDVSERLTTLGFDRVAQSPVEFGGWLKAELPRWAKVIAEAKIPKTE